MGNAPMRVLGLSSSTDMRGMRVRVSLLAVLVISIAGGFGGCGGSGPRNVDPPGTFSLDWMGYEDQILKPGDAKMGLPGLDMRMAIALGKIDSFPKTRVSHGRGEAFQLSGQALDSLHRAKFGNMSFIGGRVDEAAALDTVVRLIDAIAGRWTVKQALAVSGGLKGMRQEEIADKFWPKKITQQAVAQHLRRAGWSAVERGVVFFEDRLKQLREPVSA